MENVHPPLLAHRRCSVDAAAAKGHADVAAAAGAAAGIIGGAADDGGGGATTARRSSSFAAAPLGDATRRVLNALGYAAVVRCALNGRDVASVRVRVSPAR
jgi:hypothetical protein